MLSPFALRLNFPPLTAVDLSSTQPLSLSRFKFESTRENRIMLPTFRQLSLEVRLIQPPGWHQGQGPANPGRAAVSAGTLIILVT